MLKFRNRHFFLIDIVVLLLSPTTALMLRLDTVRIPRSFWLGLVVYTLVALLIRVVVFRRFGLYSRYWRYASIDELVQIGTAVLVSTFLITIAMLLVRLIYPFAFARSIIIIDSLLVLLAVGGTALQRAFHGEPPLRSAGRQPAHADYGRG